MIHKRRQIGEHLLALERSTLRLHVLAECLRETLVKLILFLVDAFFAFRFEQGHLVGALGASEIE